MKLAKTMTCSSTIGSDVIERTITQLGEWTIIERRWYECKSPDSVEKKQDLIQVISGKITKLKPCSFHLFHKSFQEQKILFESFFLSFADGGIRVLDT